MAESYPTARLLVLEGKKEKEGSDSCPRPRKRNAIMLHFSDL